IYYLHLFLDGQPDRSERRPGTIVIVRSHSLPSFLPSRYPFTSHVGLIVPLTYSLLGHFIRATDVLLLSDVDVACLKTPANFPMWLLWLSGLVAASVVHGQFHESEPCFCKIGEAVESCRCDEPNIDQLNNVEIYDKLQKLLKRDFFRFYRVSHQTLFLVEFLVS
ncbi:hypothetical protein GCK32_021307, partial [Trichostrongylus colubriformis]